MSRSRGAGEGTPVYCFNSGRCPARYIGFQAAEASPQSPVWRAIAPGRFGDRLDGERRRGYHAISLFLHSIAARGKAPLPSRPPKSERVRPAPVAFVDQTPVGEAEGHTNHAARCTARFGVVWLTGPSSPEAKQGSHCIVSD